MCIRKTEKLVLDFLMGKGWAVQSNVPFWWAMHSRHLPFDLVVRDARTGWIAIVEVDGMQHFVDLAKWQSLVRVMRSRGIFKEFHALHTGAHASGVVGIVRLHQQDVWDTRFGWQQQLESAIRAFFDASLPAPTVVYLARTPSCSDAHRADLAAALASPVPPTYNPADDTDDSDEHAAIDPPASPILLNAEDVAQAAIDPPPASLFLLQPDDVAEPASSPLPASEPASPILFPAVMAPTSPVLLPAVMEAPAAPSAPLLQPTPETELAALFGPRRAGPALSLRLARPRKTAPVTAAVNPAPLPTDAARANAQAAQTATKRQATIQELFARTKTSKFD